MHVGQTIFLSVIVFLGITMLLVGMLLFAKSRLTAGGLVKIRINKEKEFEVAPGSTLLSTLSEEKIFLPSACGGGGTCGLCRCQIVNGGGSILPTETGFFTRRQIHDHWRLGCQVKIKEDLDILVPEEILGVKKWECEVLSNHNVASFIKEFVVKLPPGETLHFKSGGYVQIDVPPFEMNFKDIFVEEQYRDEWEKYKMWDLKIKTSSDTFRAYSMANHPAEGNMIKLNIRIATPPWDKDKQDFKKVPPGICSSYLFSRKPGDKVMVSGPFGEFFIKDTGHEMIYIGGGAGMAPLRSHIFHLFQTLKTNRKVSYWYGARSRREIFYENDFRQIEKNFKNFRFNIALSEPMTLNNWDGYKGFIHQVLYDEYLSKHEAPEDIEYYLCGPPAMNEAVLGMLYNLGVPDEMIAFDDFGA
jgi:Na+-transporting NADH:ubiquinone oxidoreductase subunit F